MDTPRSELSERRASRPNSESPELPGPSRAIHSSLELPVHSRPPKRRKVKKTSEREVAETPPHRQKSAVPVLAARVTEKVIENSIVKPPL
jgi:hypothetical protein